MPKVKQDPQTLTHDKTAADLAADPEVQADAHPITGSVEWVLSNVIHAMKRFRNAGAPHTTDATIISMGERERPDHHAPTIISAAVAEQRYEVNAQTIGEAVRDKSLTDYRPAGHAKNAPHQVDEREVANRWTKRPAPK